MVEAHLEKGFETLLSHSPHEAVGHAFVHNSMALLCM